MQGTKLLVFLCLGALAVVLGSSPCPACDRTKPTIALLAATENTQQDLDDVRLRLLGTGKFSSIETFDIGTSTPSVNQLSPFDSLFVFTSTCIAEPITLGNNIAEYLDTPNQRRGLLVAGLASLSDGCAGLQGALAYQNIVNPLCSMGLGGFQLVGRLPFYFRSEDSIGVVPVQTFEPNILEEDHPVFRRIDTLSTSGVAAYKLQQWACAAPCPDGSPGLCPVYSLPGLAQYSGVPQLEGPLLNRLVVTRDDQRIFGLVNVFPPTATANPDTDTTRLITNILRYVSKQHTCAQSCEGRRVLVIGTRVAARSAQAKLARSFACVDVYEDVEFNEVNTPTLALLRKYGAVVVVSFPAYRTEYEAVLAQYVSIGGGVVLDIDLTAFSTGDDPFASYQPWTSGSTDVRPINADESGQLIQNVPESPLLRGFTQTEVTPPIIIITKVVNGGTLVVLSEKITFDEAGSPMVTVPLVGELQQPSSGGTVVMVPLVSDLEGNQGYVLLRNAANRVYRCTASFLPA